MKTVKIILMLLSIMALMSVCDDPSPYQTGVNADPTFEVTVEATVDNFEFGDGTVIHVFSGSTERCNLVNSVCYSLDGKIEMVNSDGDFSIQNGIVNFNCLQSDSKICGNFDGIGNLHDSKFSFEGAILLNEKTNCFACVDDILSLQIEGEALKDINKLHYVIKVKE